MNTALLESLRDVLAGDSREASISHGLVVVELPADALLATAGKLKSDHGFDLFLDPDYRLFLTLARGEWSICGFRAGDLRQHIDGLTVGRASYLIKRLRTHGLIKKVAHTYKYFFTKLGRRVVVTALVMREYFVQPSLVRAAL